jgi:hypothetical protein
MPVITVVPDAPGYRSGDTATFTVSVEDPPESSRPARVEGVGYFEDVDGTPSSPVPFEGDVTFHTPDKFIIESMSWEHGDLVVASDGQSASGLVT